MSNLSLGDYVPNANNKQTSWADAAEEAESYEDHSHQAPRPTGSQPQRLAPQRDYNDTQRSAQRYDNRSQDDRSNYGDRRQDDRAAPYDDRQRRGYNDSRGAYADTRSDGRQRAQYNDRPQQYDNRRDPQGPRRDDRREQYDTPREYTPVPIPTQPPWKAYFGNLPFDVTEQQIVEFCDPGVVLSVILPKDRDGNFRGSAFVEFETQEDLVQVIKQYNGHSISGRAVRIDAAKSRDDRPQRSYNSDRQSEPRRQRYDSTHSGGGDAPPRSRRTSVNDPTIPVHELTEEEKAARPKLQLQKRTVAEQPAAIAPTTKTDIFGGARPREEVLAERPPEPKHADDKSPDQASVNSSPTIVQAQPNSNVVKILTSPVLAPQSDISKAQSNNGNKYQAKAPTVQSIQRDRKLATEKRQQQPPQPQNNGRSAERKDAKRDYKPNTSYQPPATQKQEEGVLKATNTFAGLDLEDDD